LRRLLAVLVLSLLAYPSVASAEQVIFLVRHAERAATPAGQPPAASHGMLGEDPPLSPEGEQRAARLAAMLASSGVKQIVTTEYKRTRQTAAPLAQKLKITPLLAAAKDPDPIVAKIKSTPGNVLIVGHSNTVPDLLKKLGVAETVTIGDNDYDNLFVVVRGAAGKATLVRLKY
jgi:broad specificity phosphatase PhoE